LLIRAFFGRSGFELRGRFKTKPVKRFKKLNSAPVAQLDRVADFESVGRGFEPLLAHQVNKGFRKRKMQIIVKCKELCKENPQNLINKEKTAHY
jgi:hypothetical protein